MKFLTAYLFKFCTCLLSDIQSENRKWMKLDDMEKVLATRPGLLGREPIEFVEMFEKGKAQYSRTSNPEIKLSIQIFFKSYCYVQILGCTCSPEWVQP